MTALKEHLKQERIAQRTFAARLGVSTGYMSEIVNGLKVPSLEVAVRIDRLTAGAVPPSVWIPEDAQISPSLKKDAA